MGLELPGQSAARACWPQRQQPDLGWARQHLSKRVAGVVLTQILPFVDPAVMKLYAQFESGVYKAVSST